MQLEDEEILIDRNNKKNVFLREPLNFLLIILFVIVTFIYLCPKPNHEKQNHVVKPIETISRKTSDSDVVRCFKYDTEDSSNLIRLEEVLQSPRQPTKDKTIFFHVTNCLSDGILNLTSRQSCAIESAAKQNPTFDVFVLFASPTYYPKHITSSTMSSLLRYPNIFLRNNNVWNYTQGTFTEEWFNSGALFKSQYVYAHTSDFLRLMSLWRWGGIYMDLDVIVKESLEKIPLNFAGAESEVLVSNAVLSFESSGYGHSIVDSILKKFIADFRGDIWGHNGPHRVTGVLHDEFCKTGETASMTSKQCKGFQVYPMNVFYPIHYSHWRYYFEEQYLDKAMRITNDSLLIHVWNKLSFSTKIKVGSKAAYGLYAERLCPNMYSSTGEYF